MHFRLTPRSMTFDDLNCYMFAFSVDFHAISQIWDATTANIMNIATEL